MLEGSVLKKPLAEHREDFEAASPIFRITHSAPPFFIIQGDKDTLVPVEEARIFAQQLKNTSENPVAYAEIQGAQHAFDMFASIRSEFVKQGVARFLTFLHAKHQSNRH